MNENLNKSFVNLSYFNLNRQDVTSDIKRNMLLRLYPRKNKNLPSFCLPKKSDITNNIIINRMNIFSSNPKKNNSPNEFSLTFSEKKNLTFVKKQKSISFFEKKETFAINLEKSYSFLLEIMNKSPDDQKNLNLVDLKGISKGLANQQERLRKILILKQEIFEYFSKSCIFNNSKEIFKCLQLLFCEIENVLEIFQLWLKNICVKTDQTEKNLDDKKEKEIFDMPHFYDIVVEILNLVLRINHKKQSDLEVLFQNEVLEKEWHHRLNHLKAEFSGDFPNSNFMSTIKTFENFFEELFDKINSLKVENETLRKDNQNVLKWHDSSETLKNTVEILQQKFKPQNISFDPQVNYSLDYLKKYEEIYKKTIEELKNENIHLENKLSAITEKNLSSSTDLTQSKRRIKQLVLTNNQETQINSILNEDNQTMNFRKNSIFMQAVSPLNHNFRISHNCLFAFLNLIFSDKISYDYSCFLDYRPFLNLQNFVLQWFLYNFGNQTYSTFVLKQLCANMLEEVKNSERCKLICNLLGFPSEKNESEDFVMVYYTSSQAAILYLKMIDFFNIKLKNYSLLSPFIPINDSIFLSYDESIKIIEYIGNCQENEILSSADLLKLYTEALNKKLIKISDKKKKKISILETFKDKRPNSYSNLSISFDVLAKFILDTISLRFEAKILEILTCLKIRQSNRKNNDFFIEDFSKILLKIFPHKTTNFISECFMEFVYNNKDNSISNIKDLMRSVAVKLCELPLAKTFYLNFEQDKAHSYYKDKYFDFTSSLIVLSELYEVLVEKIESNDMKNDNFFVLHEHFKKEYMRFPKNGKSFNRVNSFMGSDEKKEIIEKIETLWKFFKKIIDFLFSKSDSL